MRIVQYSLKNQSDILVGAQLGQDGDIVDLSNALKVGSALEFIKAGTEALSKASKYVCFISFVYF